MSHNAGSVVPIGPMLAATMVALGISAPAGAQESDPAALVEALQGGGHIVFFRHGKTESDYADQVDAVMGDCSTQRVLSEEGWQEVKAIGAAFERLDIPVGEVISSEYCRAWKTADLAFGRYEKNADLNFESSEDYTEEQLAAMRDRMTPHLSAVPEEGNTVLVGHDDPFEAATGIYPDPMGVVFVLRPEEGGSFEVLGSVAPDQWDDL